MWYIEKYNETIQFIKDNPKAISEKEYRKIVKNLKLLSPESLIYITGLNFNEIVRKARNGILKEYYIE